MVTKLTFALLALLTLPVAGCGGGGSAPGAAHNSRVIHNAQHAAASEQSIARSFLNLPNARANSATGDVEYLAPGEDPADLSTDSACTVVTILASPGDLAPYKGDPDVVENPAGTAGVKVTGTDQYQAGCMQVAANVLKGLS